MQLIVVGHGPSILTGRGSVIDSFDVIVRLKRGVTNPAIHWGSRTDYLCACSPRFKDDRPFWLVEQSGLPKLTTGTAAVLEAQRRLNPKDIFVIGFDRLMHPEREDPPNTWLAHNKWAEHSMLRDLGVRELGKVR